MKVFTIIFSIYILVLSSIPCGDSIGNIVKTTQIISATDNHNHSTDLCTPFCSCTCCSTSAFYHTLSSFVMPKELFQSMKFNMVNSSCLSSNFHSIWQPPKLA